MSSNGKTIRVSQETYQKLKKRKHRMHEKENKIGSLDAVIKHLLDQAAE